MPSALAPLFETRSRWFDLCTFVMGVLLFGYSVASMVDLSVGAFAPALLAIPLVVMIAKFPMVLDNGDGSIEVGFDSSVLMFLLSTLRPHQALVIWSLSVLATQVSTSKRPQVKIFNIGVGIIGGAAASGVLHLVRGNQLGTPRELLAVTLAAALYFGCDFLISAFSLAIDSSTPLGQHLTQRGTLIAVACFVPFDSLGYLGAVVVRSTPWWTLILLAVPLATLLVATRAVTRGGENARRLTVLFDAAVRAQSLSNAKEVVAALTEDARRLLRMQKVQVRSTPPGVHEIGAQVHGGAGESWIVAPGRLRARSTMTADQLALEAMVAVASDAFARVKLTEDMTYLARHDLLTDLPNRRLLLDRVKHAVEFSRVQGLTIALLFVDLDGFKPVNDRFGHAAGDEVLIDVARRLGTCVRQRDTVARLGGDEFALLFDDVQPPDVSSACERILATLSEGVDVAGHHLQLGASIGVAYGSAEDTAEGMLRKADLAMYAAKSRGKNQYVEYEPSIGQSRVQRLELVESLRAALVAGDIKVVYQPVVGADSGRICGVEALARWQLDGCNIPPDVFIRVAEESGLIVELGDQVLYRTASDAAALRAAAGGPIDICVNVSAKQLREPAFVGTVENAVQVMGDTRLVLEITERDGIGDDEVSLATMKRLAEVGVHFAIDDFGVGFSSISYLQDMPIHVIKADASFSSHIDSDERACALLRSITMMGEALGLDVIVEGIERITQLEHLQNDVHAAYAQGFLMHRPMPLGQLLDVVRKNRSVPTLVPVPQPAQLNGAVVAPVAAPMG
ncbi:MAG: putative bifunctional diguanylate cyclase/phosphodiesterase [Marmoricola sp.]